VTGNAWLFLGTVVTAALGLWGVVYAARRPGRATPYDLVIARVVTLENQRTADRAEIESLQDARRKDRHEIENLQGEVLALKGERAHALTEITGLQRRVEAMYADRDNLVRYIGVLRTWVASGAKPPPPPVPPHLANVVPEWVPADGAAILRPTPEPEEVPRGDS
jgi:hypothetical protein